MRPFILALGVSTCPSCIPQRCGWECWLPTKRLQSDPKRLQYGSKVTSQGSHVSLGGGQNRCLRIPRRLVGHTVFWWDTLVTSFPRLIWESPTIACVALSLFLLLNGSYAALKSGSTWQVSYAVLVSCGLSQDLPNSLSGGRIVVNQICCVIS